MPDPQTPRRPPDAFTNLILEMAEQARAWRLEDEAKAQQKEPA